jgi:membrane protease YdiL (CAAX protease family)
VDGAAAPGWFVDPWQPDQYRWWDGTQWAAPTSRLPGMPVRPRMPTLPLPAALGAIAVTAVALIGSRFVLDALGRFQWPIIAYLALSVLLAYGPMLVYCLWASRRWGTGRLSRDAGFTVRWSDAGWGPVVWLAAFGAEIAVALFVLATRIPIRSNTEGIDDVSGERGVIIAVLISAVIAAPFIEELVFRGVILRGLASTLSAWLAVVVQGVLFGAAHSDASRGLGNIGLVLVLSSVGIVFGGAALLLRRIGPTIIAHAIFNGVVLLIVLFVRT